MSNTFWFVMGGFTGWAITYAIYRVETRGLNRALDRYERHCRKLAYEYGEQTKELERLRHAQ